MPPPPTMTPQQLYSSDVVGSPSGNGVVAYPNLMCPTPPPPASQLLLHQHYQQQQQQQQLQQSVCRHNGGGPQSVQYVHVDHQHMQQYAGPPPHHSVGVHYQPPPPPPGQVRTMTLGRYHNNHKPNHHHDRSAEIPLLLATQPGLHHQHQMHQRESTV